MLKLGHNLSRCALFTKRELTYHIQAAICGNITQFPDNERRSCSVNLALDWAQPTACAKTALGFMMKLGQLIAKSMPLGVKTFAWDAALVVMIVSQLEEVALLCVGWVIAKCLKRSCYQAQFCVNRFQMHPSTLCSILMYHQTTTPRFEGSELT